MIISIEQQIAAMARQWPQFAVMGHADRTAIWEGVLAPDKREYLVRIAYRVPLVIENATPLSVQPRVQVLHPKLERHPDYEQGPIPHVYRGRKEPGPFLCLFDPTAGEWSIEDEIAHTTVFWAAEWLYFYEGWLLTRRWRGGGVYHGPANDDPGQKKLEAV